MVGGVVEFAGRLLEDDPDAIAVLVLDVEDRSSIATRHGLLDIRDVLGREARHSAEGEPPQRDRDAQVDYAFAAVPDLDPGEPRLAGRRVGTAIRTGSGLAR